MPCMRLTNLLVQMDYGEPQSMRILAGSYFYTGMDQPLFNARPQFNKVLINRASKQELSLLH